MIIDSDYRYIIENKYFKLSDADLVGNGRPRWSPAHLSRVPSGREKLVHVQQAPLVLMALYPVNISPRPNICFIKTLNNMKYAYPKIRFFNDICYITCLLFNMK